MKWISCLFLSIICLSCQTTTKNYQSTEPTLITTKLEDALKKRDTILALSPTILEYNKIFHGKTMSFTASYYLDTLFADYYRRYTLRTRGISIKTNDDNEWPREICQEIEDAMRIDLSHNKESIDRTIKRYDLNFDTYADMYFVKGGYAQNTSYVVYLYDKEEKKYTRATDFEELSWSKIESNGTKKRIYIYNHHSDKEGSKNTYTTTEQGKLTLIASETTTRIKGKGNKLWLVKGRLEGGEWKEDTTPLK